MYRLNLSEDGRILSACEEMPKGNYDGMPKTDTLPEGDIYEYRYAGGEFIHDPLPAPEPGETPPTPEERITALEEALDLILSGVTE